MSASKLCIDWGNSFVKIALFDQNDKITERYVLNADEVIDQLHKEIVPRRIFSGAILSSVTNQHQELLSALKEITPNVVVLDNKTQLPILNAYSSSETLGADRIALACAAHAAFPDKNNLIVSVGTCITYNFIGKNRTFRGGAISPGVQMRLDAMHHFTAKLPVVKADGDQMLIGYDTETGMRSGAIYGTIAEIDGIINMYETQYPDFNAILTGGGAPVFAGKLKSKIFADPEILLKGLNQILKHNVPQTR
ncbi:MAG TPA: type III pantothenate kinase [Chitinophagaceae bacterium]|nr:type III pantothenate kinase [Chitinophagaceae bacterium]